MTSTMTAISPSRAAELMRQGAILIDVRGADEHARERIVGARHVPLARIDGELPVEGSDAIIFHCRSGARTAANAPSLEQAAGPCRTYLLDGGLDAWKKAGLPVVRDPRQPIELMRQVQIVAGSLVLLGALLGTMVAPAFYALSAFVGAGLVFAGATGFCGMATLLGRMPWNRRAAAAR